MAAERLARLESIRQKLGSFSEPESSVGSLWALCGLLALRGTGLAALPRCSGAPAQVGAESRRLRALGESCFNAGLVYARAFGSHPAMRGRTLMSLSPSIRWRGLKGASEADFD